MPSVAVLFCFVGALDIALRGAHSCAAFSPPSSSRRDVSLGPSSNLRQPVSRRQPKSFVSTLPLRTESSEDLFFAQDLDSGTQQDFSGPGGVENENTVADMGRNNGGGWNGSMFDTSCALQQEDYYAQGGDECQDQMEFPSQPTKQQPSPRSPQAESTFASKSSYGDAGAAASASGSQQPISSVDARVLESILQEGKLDLSTEEQVKKLLEGPRLQEGEDLPGGEKDDGKYSSKFVSVSARPGICVFLQKVSLLAILKLHFLSTLNPPT